MGQVKVWRPFVNPRFLYVSINLNVTLKQKTIAKPLVSCLSVPGHLGDATLVSPGAHPLPWPPARGSGCRSRWVEVAPETSQSLQLLMGPQEEMWGEWIHTDWPWTEWAKLFGKQHIRGTKECENTERYPLTKADSVSKSAFKTLAKGASIHHRLLSVSIHLTLIFL